jgi:hypothetical protein
MKVDGCNEVVLAVVKEDYISPGGVV